MRQHWLYRLIISVISLVSLIFYYILYNVISKNSEAHLEPSSDKTKIHRVLDFYEQDFEANPFFRKWKNLPCQSCSIPELNLLIPNTNRCVPSTREIKMLFLVNSKSTNVDERKVIRETWARREAMNRWGMCRRHVSFKIFVIVTPKE